MHIKRKSSFNFINLIFKFLELYQSINRFNRILNTNNNFTNFFFNNKNSTPKIDQMSSSPSSATATNTPTSPLHNHNQNHHLTTNNHSSSPSKTKLKAEKDNQDERLNPKRMKLSESIENIANPSEMIVDDEVCLNFNVSFLKRNFPKSLK